MSRKRKAGQRTIDRDRGKKSRNVEEVKDKTDRTYAKPAEEDDIPTYHYNTLRGKQTIRLLRLIPGPELAFKLLHVDVHKAPPYLAISYTWGSHTSRDLISIDGQTVSIHKSLADAMRNMQNHIRENGLMLWVDSVCINQASVMERSHQVALMHSIYRCAECVGIWLGDLDDDLDLALGKLVEWRKEFDRVCRDFKDNWELAVNSIAHSNTTFYGSEDSLHRSAWRAFQNLTQRPWWGRAWTVQEASALGPSRTLLFCGNHMFDWSTLRIALRLSHHVTNFETQGMSLTFAQGQSAFRIENFRYDRERGEYIRLFTVLELIRTFECQDARDKLYASLGLAADISETDFSPDYTRSVQDVYTDIARFSISQSESHSLDFLGLVVRCHEDLGVIISDLPSWIPDLRIRIGMYAFERYLDVGDFGSPRAYDASGNQGPLPSIDAHRLRVHGFELDRIEKVYPVCYHNLATGGLYVERQWHPENEMEAYPLGGTYKDAYDHTLLADIGRPMVPSEHLQRGLKVDWNLIDQDVRSLSPKEKQARSRMLIDIKRTTFGRRLIQSKGGLIGLGPGLAEVGDIVCVLFGGHVLYVLRKRPRSRFYQFIGECYIHGMMDGQALTSLAARKEFVIV